MEPKENRAESRDVEGTLTQEQERVLTQEAIHLAQAGDFDDAVRSLHAILDSDPRSALALRILGLVFHLMGRSTVANETLSRAIMLNPHDSVAFYYRCMVNSPSNADSAIRDCETAISLAPDYANAHAVLSAALLSVGRTLDAEHEAMLAIKLDPDNLLAASVHGKVLIGLGRFAAAESEFRRAMGQVTSNRQ